MVFSSLHFHSNSFAKSVMSSFVAPLQTYQLFLAFPQSDFPPSRDRLSDRSTSGYIYHVVKWLLRLLQRSRALNNWSVLNPLNILSPINKIKN